MRGSTACAENGRILAETPLSPDQRSAQSLVPAVASLLQAQNWRPADLDAVAVAMGPGSFTGLRIGIVTAKILAWACKTKLYGIDSLDATAFQISSELSEFAANQEENPFITEFAEKGAAIVSAALDAQRGDVVFRDYLISAKSKPIPLTTSFSLIPLKQWVDDSYFSERLSSGFPIERPFEDSLKSILATKDLNDLPFFYAGSFLWSRRAKFSLEQSVHFLPERLCSPTAKGVALAASFQSPVDPFDLVPVYSRESAAEEKRKLAK